jgi:hypothetical protein
MSEGTIKYCEKVQSSSGNTYYKLSMEEPEYTGRKMVSFTKDELVVTQRLKFTYKENPDGSWIVTPEKKFNGFGGGYSAKVDVNLEILKMSVSLCASGVAELKSLEVMAKRLKEIYNSL